MQIEWDSDKDVANQAKHGVSFEFAARLFDDPNYVLREDRIDENGEQRWHAVGMAGGTLLLIVHVYRSSEHGEETIRIISARKASKRESRGYFR